MTRINARFLALLLTVTVACDPDSDTDTDIGTDTDTSDADTAETSAISTTQVVGAAGGTLVLDNGASLTIPAGALDADVELGLEYVQDLTELAVAELPEGFEGMGDSALVLTPHGTVFNEPVTVTMPTTLTDDEFGLWRLADEDAETWESDGAATLEAGMLSFDLYEFSIYSPAAVAAGNCPCFNSTDLNDWAGRQRILTSRGFGTVNAIIAYPYGTRDYVGTWAMGGRTQCDPPSGPRVTTTRAQHLACNALVSRRFRSRSRTNLEIAVYADGLPTDETVDVELTVTPPGTAQTLEVPAELEMVWAQGVFPSGVDIAASVTSAPVGFECTPTSGTGTLGTENVAIRVDCIDLTACDDDFAGPWRVQEPVTSLDEVVTLTGTRADWSFELFGDTVNGSVDGDDIVTGEIVGSSDSWSFTSGLYECAPDTDEVMTITVNRDFEATFTLTAE